MSQENLEDFIRSAYDRFNEAEPDPSGEHKFASGDFYDRDAVYVDDARDPDAGIHCGIEAVRQQVGRWVEAYPDLQVEPVEIHMEPAHVVTVTRGKVLRVEECSDRADGLKAAGLRE